MPALSASVQKYNLMLLAVQRTLSFENKLVRDASHLAAQRNTENHGQAGQRRGGRVVPSHGR